MIVWLCSVLFFVEKKERVKCANDVEIVTNYDFPPRI